MVETARHVNTAGRSDGSTKEKYSKDFRGQAGLTNKPSDGMSCFARCHATGRNLNSFHAHVSEVIRLA